MKISRRGYVLSVLKRSQDGGSDAESYQLSDGFLTVKTCLCALSQQRICDDQVHSEGMDHYLSFSLM